MKGNIYFILEGDLDERGAIKIGFTAGSPQARLENFQTGNSSPLSLLGSLPGTKQDEVFMHRLFRPWKIRGEWYRLSDRLLTFVNDLVLSDTPTSLPVLRTVVKLIDETMDYDAFLRRIAGKDGNGVGQRPA